MEVAIDGDRSGNQLLSIQNPIINSQPRLISSINSSHNYNSGDNSASILKLIQPLERKTSIVIQKKPSHSKVAPTLKSIDWSKHSSIKSIRKRPASFCLFKSCCEQLPTEPENEFDMDLTKYRAQQMVEREDTFKVSSGNLGTFHINSIQAVKDFRLSKASLGDDDHKDKLKLQGLTKTIDKPTVEQKKSIFYQKNPPEARNLRESPDFVVFKHARSNSRSEIHSSGSEGSNSESNSSYKMVEESVSALKSQREALDPFQEAEHNLKLKYENGSYFYQDLTNRWKHSNNIFNLTNMAEMNIEGRLDTPNRSSKKSMTQPPEKNDSIFKRSSKDVNKTIILGKDGVVGRQGPLIRSILKPAGSFLNEQKSAKKVQFI